MLESKTPAIYNDSVLMLLKRANRLRHAGERCKSDDASDAIFNKMREAELQTMWSRARSPVGVAVQLTVIAKHLDNTHNVGSLVLGPRLKDVARMLVEEADFTIALWTLRAVCELAEMYDEGLMAEEITGMKNGIATLEKLQLKARAKAAN